MAKNQKSGFFYFVAVNFFVRIKKVVDLKGDQFVV